MHPCQVLCYCCFADLSTASGDATKKTDKRQNESNSRQFVQDKSFLLHATDKPFLKKYRRVAVSPKMETSAKVTSTLSLAGRLATIMATVYRNIVVYF